MDDTHENIDDYGVNKKKQLIVFDDNKKQKTGV